MIRLFSRHLVAAIAFASTVTILTACSGSQTVNPAGPQVSTPLTTQTQNHHRIQPTDAYGTVLQYAQGIGFSDAQLYGFDTGHPPVGMDFGTYTGSVPHPYNAVLLFAKNNGFPNAQLYGFDVQGNPTALVFQ